MLPTAEEILFDFTINDEIDDLSKESKGLIAYRVIEFTKIYVTEALKTAADNAVMCQSSANTDMIDRESILNAYPLDNIK